MPIAASVGHIIDARSSLASPLIAEIPANPDGLTAAHRTLTFGTHVRVTDRRNGRSITVRINDRGPLIRGRVIDITPAAASALGFYGLAPVKLELAEK